MGRLEQDVVEGDLVVDAVAIGRYDRGREHDAGKKLIVDAGADDERVVGDFLGCVAKGDSLRKCIGLAVGHLAAKFRARDGHQTGEAHGDFLAAAGDALVGKAHL